jgi:probable rRNA maturation factor
MLEELLPGMEIELSVVLVGESAMRMLNSRYLNKDEPTDVLAFPQMTPGDLEELKTRKVGLTEPLGDIVVCVPVAARQAVERGEAEVQELELLCAHGLLHLMGYEDETEEGAEGMAEMERTLLGRSIM